MMKNIFFLVLFSSIIAGCTKTDIVERDCIDSVLLLHDLDPYIFGQEIGCKLFLDLYHYKGMQFFEFQGHCVDMSSFPFDCQGNLLCQEGQDSECIDFRNNAIRKGTIGIQN